MASDPATGRIVRTNNAAIDKTGLDYDRIQASKNQPSTIISDVTIGHTIEEIRTKRVPLVMAGGWVIPEAARRAVWTEAWGACAVAAQEIVDAERAEANGT